MIDVPKEIHYVNPRMMPTNAYRELILDLMRPTGSLIMWAGKLTSETEKWLATQRITVEGELGDVEIMDGLIMMMFFNKSLMTTEPLIEDIPLVWCVSNVPKSAKDTGISSMWEGIEPLLKVVSEYHSLTTLFNRK